MRTLSLFATALVVAIFLSACKTNEVSLDFTNAKGEVPTLTNLTFRFDKALIADSLINQWDSTEYISFEPAISGRFRWEAPDQLIFSPSSPLAPATDYRAKMKDELLLHSSFDKVKTKEDIQFHTAPLQFMEAQATWVVQDEDSRVAVPQVALTFNYPVNPEELTDKLQITVEGARKEYVLQTLTASNTIIVRLPAFRGEDKNYEARVLLAKGIRPVGGRNASARPIESQLTISSPFVLTVNQVESDHDGTEGSVRIYTNQQLTGENIKQFIRFEPAVAYRAEFTDYGVTLSSDKFDAEKSYELVIGKGLRGRIGGVLKEAFYGSVAFGELESDIRFTSSKGVYLSKRGGGNVEVRIINTPKVKLIVSKVYQNNLLLAQRQGYEPEERYPDSWRMDDGEGEEDYRYSAVTMGDIVYSKEIDTRSLPRSAGGRILNLSQFEDRLPEYKGIYHIQIRSASDYWVSDSRFISFSDIGLIAKEAEDKIYVFANSIQTARGINGAIINAYGHNNQLLGTGTTNEDGMAELALTRQSYAGFRPAMIIATTADDFTYLPFNNTRVNTSRFEVGGRKNNITGIDAFVYAERDIYRPGERLHFALLLRDRQWKSPGPIPVKVKFLLPNGKELKNFRKTLNEGGATEGSVDLPAAALTGSYLLEVYSANDVLLAAKNFMVEEFVPDRIKVTAGLDKSTLRPGDEVTVSIHAANFFGPPAADRNYEVEVQVKQKQFLAKAFRDYNFTLAHQNSFYDKVLLEGKTDNAGNAAERYTVPALYANAGMLQANFYATVFDETGRPVSRLTTCDIATQAVFNGIRNDGYSYYPLNQPVNFQLIALNKEGTVVQAPTRVQVIKHEYRTLLAKSGSHFRYESQKEEKMVASHELTVGNGTTYVFVPRSPGDYELRILRPGAAAYVSKRFYSYGSWGGDNNSFEVNNEGHIDIELDKESYKSGSTAKLLFKTPFSGRLLVTVERDKLLSYQYLDVAKRTASMELKLEGAHVPNIYITATLIKPHDRSDIPLTVAQGFQNIRVEEDSRKMPVAITAQKTARSQTRQHVQIKAAPHSYVTLAAVDNGVLQVTDFKTPDPYGHYYQKRALEVAAYNMYPLLFPELRTRWSSTGGDGEADMQKRINPMPAKRIQIVSFWSGIKKTDGNGNATFSFEVPQFSGQVRLMAVAYKEERFGSAEALMQVADPVVIQSALPRFLSPGDTALVPVTFSNTTDRAIKGQAAVAIQGPFKLIDAGSQPIEIAAHSEKKAFFSVVAQPAIGTGRIVMRLQTGGEKFTETTEIAVRPPASLQKMSGSGSIAGSAQQRMALPREGFIAGSMDYELVIGRSPLIEITDQLRYLLQYPYGCTEQAISIAFPQLYFSDLTELVGGSAVQKGAANTHIQEAIRSIKMRQLYNGAVTLWDGHEREDWWTTAYAAHFLLEARHAGFSVDNSLLETMLGYLTYKLKTKETITYHYNRDQQKKIAPKEVAYSLYILAKANKTQVSAMNYYKANPELLALDSRYLLAAAFAAAGDKKSFTAFLPASFSGEASVQQTGGSFYSAIRDEAIALNALMDVDPGNAQVPVLARQVSRRLKEEGYLNTQERAFSFLALGKVARQATRSKVTAEIKADGKTVARVNGETWKGGKSLLQATSLEIATTGSGRLYYSWQAEGISATGTYKEEDNFIKIRRSFFDRNGQPLTGNTFRQNELIIVALTLEKTYSHKIENIVITDLLPAGFEIENPRTKELPGMDWIKNAAQPTALDVRDDRIHFFVDASKDKQVYYYAVRAVSLGHFRQGPVGADAMYDGAIHSYHGARMIRVLP